MTDRLKPCPFCGRKPEMRHENGGFSYVVCANDGCYVRTDGHLNDTAAITAWNTRKPMDSIVQELEAEAERWYESGKEFKDKTELGVASGFRYAIEIVKEGGKDV